MSRPFFGRVLLLPFSLPDRPDIPGLHDLGPGHTALVQKPFSNILLKGTDQKLYKSLKIAMFNLMKSLYVKYNKLVIN